MAIIGREEEIYQLRQASSSDKPELIAVYGRRRVGKTFLINQTFNGQFDFAHNGLSPAELDDLKKENGRKTFLQLQLTHFHKSLREYGWKGKEVPEDWLDAFHMLSMLLKEKKADSKQIIFIDELPWLDTPKSYFATAFESFCNGYASRENLMIIVAGSATSWMMKHLVNSHGGLYGRVTKEIVLSPFGLRETEMMLQSKNISYSRYDIARTYMVFGGIPYYLDYIDGRYSLPENIDRLLFRHSGVLSNEFERLFSASFDNANLALKITRALSEKGIGLSRDDILKQIQCTDGQTFSDSLKALLLSGYIIKYSPLQEGKKESLYKLIDPFCLFYLRFVEGNESLDEHFFLDNESSGKLQSWKGFAFETLCYNHLNQIKSALGVSGVATSRFSFVQKGDGNQPGAQVDLVLERKDNIVSLCELKFYSDEYRANASDDLDVRNKKSVLSRLIKKRQSIQTVLITTFGLKPGQYQWTYQKIVTLDDLFSR